MVAAMVTAVKKAPSGYQIDLSYVAFDFVLDLVLVFQSAKSLRCRKKKLTPEETHVAMTKYNQKKIVNSILKYTALQSGVSLEKCLYKRFAWRLEQSPYDLFVAIGSNPAALLPFQSILGAKAYPVLGMWPSNIF